MANAWLTHVKKTLKAMKSEGTYTKGDGLKKVIMEAKKSYKKHRGGEEAEETSAPAPAPAAPTPTAGRRRKTRRGGKSRRHSRK